MVDKPNFSTQKNKKKLARNKAEKNNTKFDVSQQNEMNQNAFVLIFRVFCVQYYFVINEMQLRIRRKKSLKHRQFLEGNKGRETERKRFQ